MKKLLISSLVSLFLITSVQATSTRDLIVSGNTLWSEGKFSEAETSFKKALEGEPASSVAHERLANLYLTQNKTSEAIEEFQNAINDDPENANLFIGIAIAYLHKQYYQMADAMVNRAMQLNPDLTNAQKLKQYIDAKKEVIEQANAKDMITDSAPHPTPEGHPMPEVVKESMK
jgi:tetratricopeptide (TPR) repeat protein